MIKNKNNEGFTGIWVPKEFLLIKELTHTEILLLSSIKSLDNEKGCYSTNLYFSEILNRTRNHISSLINRLNERDFIDCYANQNLGNKRIININPSIDRLLQPIQKQNDSYNDIPIYPITTEPIYNNKDYSKYKNTPSLLFLENNDIDSFKSLKDKYSNIDDWESFKDAFNAQCITDDIPNKVNKIAARFETYARHWVKNQPKKEKTKTSKLPQQNIDKSFKWFIDQFNKLTGKDFKETEEVKKLFIKQLENGFTGYQMTKAIQNLYSSNNTWHKKNNFQYATPKFLLTDDRVNEFFNFNI
jgi:hypothetical protein